MLTELQRPMFPGSVLKVIGGGWWWLTSQGGILFWLCGNLQDWPGISPEIALIKSEDNDRKSVYFLKFTGNHPYKQELILIDRKTRQQFHLKYKN
jgi:hypothetical protein